MEKQKYLTPTAESIVSVLSEHLLDAALPNSGKEVPGDWDDDEESTSEEK